MAVPQQTVALIALAYVYLIATSGIVVSRVLKYINRTYKNGLQMRNITSSERDLGVVIGKCENVLVLSFVLLGAYTGLAIIFAAKNLVRAEDIGKNTQYYLGGTLVNFTYSVLMAGLVSFVISRPRSVQMFGFGIRSMLCAFFASVSILATAVNVYKYGNSNS